MRDDGPAQKAVDEGLATVGPINLLRADAAVIVGEDLRVGLAFQDLLLGACTYTDCPGREDNECCTVETRRCGTRTL